jgi:hypothetical protein
MIDILFPASLAIVAIFILPLGRLRAPDMWR